jgi:FkbM family methyltransferase
MTIKGCGPTLARSELFRTYVRLKLKGVLRRGPANSKKVSERLLGFTIECFEYSTLVYLFEEMFLGQDYYFSTEAKAPLIVDGGSNVGISVLFFKTVYPQCRILAFEPDEAAFSLLQKNVQVNHLESIELHRKALQKTTGETTFYFDPAHPGSTRMSAVASRMPKASVRVEGVRLSDYVNEPVDFLKLDIEGSETSVVEDLAETGKLRLVKEMVVEYHHHIEPDQNCFSKFLDILESHGFGYQIVGPSWRPQKKQFEDILVYAYST